jgi:hypothetical protein
VTNETIIAILCATVISLIAGHYYSVVKSIADNKKDCEERDAVLTIEVMRLKDQVNSSALAVANAATVAANAALTAAGIQLKRQQFDDAGRGK